MSIRTKTCSLCGTRMEISFVNDGSSKVTTTHGVCSKHLKPSPEDESTLTKKPKQRATLRELLTAIRSFCVHTCQSGSRKGVRECTSKNCQLYPHRMGYFSSSDDTSKSENSQQVSRVSCQGATISEGAGS
jgi:hypothetical protein